MRPYETRWSSGSSTRVEVLPSPLGCALGPSLLGLPGCSPSRGFLPPPGRRWVCSPLGCLVVLFLGLLAIIPSGLHWALPILGAAWLFSHPRLRLLVCTLVVCMDSAPHLTSYNLSIVYGSSDMSFHFLWWLYRFCPLARGRELFTCFTSFRSYGILHSYFPSTS